MKLQNQRIRLFSHLALTIIYCMATHQLIFTSQYQKAFSLIDSEMTKEFFAVENAYLIAMEEENPALNIAQDHFTQKTLPKIFMSCNNTFYSIWHFKNSQYIPPKWNNWYDPIFDQGTTKYYSTYKVKGYTDLDFGGSGVEKSTDDEIIVYLYLNGVSTYDYQRYLVGDFRVYLNFNYEVLKVEGAKYANHLPIYGRGISPKGYDCEFLQSNNGNVIK